MKYDFTEHAERNSVYNAARCGIALEGCTIFVSWIPCPDCTRAIIQCGIKQIYIDGRDFQTKAEYWRERWGEKMMISLQMLREAEIAIHSVDEDGRVAMVYG
jgi:dCMP deaminase